MLVCAPRPLDCVPRAEMGGGDIGKREALKQAKANFDSEVWPGGGCGGSGEWWLTGCVSWADVG